MHLASEISEDRVLPARLPKDFEIGGCVVEGWLRDGGMAAIYRGRRVEDARRVAIKLQLPSTVSDERFCAHFDLEAEAMRRVKEIPQIVEILDGGLLGDGRRYLVLEWIEGGDLEELIDRYRDRDERIAVSMACRIGQQIALGLAAMHERGLIHRDLKPANVMVPLADHDGAADVVKLVDFGIVADLRAETSEPQEEHVPVGTSAYMPPEQLTGQTPSPALDLYSLGLVLFEAITGSTVPPDGWSPETLRRVETLRRGVPEALGDLVHGCIRSDPDERPSSAADVAERLGQLIRTMESDPASSVSIRTGETEFVNQSSAVDRRPKFAAGGTEISLTHQEVLTQSGMAPLYVPLPPEADEPRDAEESGRSGSLLRWGGVAAVVLLLGVGAWWVSFRGADGVPDEEQGAVVASSPPRPVPESGDDGRMEKSVPMAENSVVEQAQAESEPESMEPVPVEAETGAKTPERPPRDSTQSKGPSREECAALRDEANGAKKKRDWNGVITATRKRACWKGARKLERKRLRVAAFAELGEFTRCVKESGKSRDNEIVARAGYCKKMLGG